MPMDRIYAEFKRDEIRKKPNGKLGRSGAVWEGNPIEGFPYKVSDASETSQRMLIYKSVDLSIELHIRISCTEFDLGDEPLCWNSSNARGSSLSARAVDLGIYSYRRTIITIVQKSELSEADPEITKAAALAVIEKVKEKYNSLT